MADSRQPRGAPRASSEQSNEGEGNRTAARRYNAKATDFAGNSSKVRRAAEKARHAMESHGRRELTDAEKQGLAKGRH